MGFSEKLESHLLVPLCWGLSYVAMPCVWIETLLFMILGLDTSTSFRMFPPPNTFLEDSHAGVSYAFGLAMVMQLPYFVSSDQTLDGRGTLGMALRPLTRRASPTVVYLIMFARVWLSAAYANAAINQLLTDFHPLGFIWKIGCVYFVL